MDLILPAKMLDEARKMFSSGVLICYDEDVHFTNTIVVIRQSDLTILKSGAKNHTKTDGPQRIGAPLKFGVPGHRKAQQEAYHRQCGWMIFATACCVPWHIFFCTSVSQN